MRIWRLVHKQCPRLDGGGAYRYGGRWNSPGMAVSYASAHLSLAVLEQLVHLDSQEWPEVLMSFEINLPSTIEITKLSLKKFSHIQQSKSRQNLFCQQGDQWIKAGKTAIMQVPSVVIPEEANFLINPKHPDFSKITRVSKTPFRLYKRLNHALVVNDD